MSLDQRPDVQGASVVIDNATGAVKAMVGGYDYNESKYNRAVQAERQVGSSFKVYVYSQALLDGISPFSTILDAPISFPSSSGTWSPHNYDNKFEGTITLLHALAESRNVPAVRLIARLGVDKVIKLCRKFGITSRLVPNLPLALGASDLTLLEHTSAFTTFPDDGVHIAPRLVERVTDYDGAVVDDFRPDITDALPAGVARIMVSMLREAINSGTAVRAKTLAAKYPIAGKTGTTNDFSDAWFIGFSPSLTCGVWVGFDDHRSLGPKEEGARVALPIWMDFMSEALQGRRAEDFPESPLLTHPDQVKEILARAGTTLLAEHATGVATTGDGGGKVSHPAPQAAPALQPTSKTPTPTRTVPLKQPAVVTPVLVKPAPAEGDLPTPPKLKPPPKAGQEGVLFPPLPDPPVLSTSERSGVAETLGHAKHNLRRAVEKVFHR